MSQPAPQKGKPGKDPFGPPLEESQVREVFRRLAARPPKEQQAFVGRVNWNLVDATTEHYLMAWLAGALGGPSSQFALETLDKLPHPKRARHVERFRALLDNLDVDTARRLQNAFGPVLGGLPKRPYGGKKPAAATATPDPKGPASGEELQRLKDFFDKFGGTKK